MHKYIVVKRDPKYDRVYFVSLYTDQELALHISSTFENTDHQILSVINTGR